MRARNAFPIVLGLAAVLLVTVARAQDRSPYSDPALFLPPPPPQGSAAAKADMADLHRVLATRTPALFAAAKADSDTENATIYEAIIGGDFSLKNLPATKKLMDDVQARGSADVKIAKKYFARLRPWAVDKTIKPCEDVTSDLANPANSYPSGHSTVGFSTGVLLAELLPSKAQAILTRARDYAQNRLMCGVHYRSDIVAGQVLGTLEAEHILVDPAAKAEVDAARAELKAAHFQ